MRANRLRHRVAVPRDSEVTAAGRGAATGAAVVAHPVSASVPAPLGPAIRHEENTMTIPPEVEAQILRLHHVEKWRRGTIARQLHVHHGTVTRVLA